MNLLAQFVFRLAFGLAAGLAATSPTLVSSGYFRVHSYVLLGLGALAAALAGVQPQAAPWWPSVALAVLSYVSAVTWLYEKPAAGRAALTAVAAVALYASWLSQGPSPSAGPFGLTLWRLDPLTSGVVLGATLAAMLLGHWYLNAPGMKLGPLKRLLLLMAAALLARALVCGLGLGCLIAEQGPPGEQYWLFLALRWLAGVLAAAALAFMAWQTLKVPNTQSATGILYVALIVVFLGELTGLLLAANLNFAGPL